MLALAIGTLLAVGALAYVLYPMFVGATAPTRRVLSGPGQSAGAAEQDAVVALREIEFDKATGKLSDADYDELRSRYTERALAAMRAGGEANESGASADEIEVAVLAMRAHLKHCDRCGPRAEPDATYCSSCGHFLPGTCTSCGAAVEAAGAAFCTSCGRQLAA